jgi:hypothetical protein
MATPTDVVNRGLQRVGSKLIAAGALTTETSKQAEQARALYDICRSAELRRNVWRFAIRTVALRPLTSDSRRVTFPAWATGTVYQVGAVATNGGVVWQSVFPDKVATVTISNATPAVISLTSHGMIVNTPFQLSTTDALPTGFAVDTTYYIIAAGFGANSFQASLTLGGAAINTTTAGSGVHTITAGMNTAQTPADSPPTYWTRYFGPLTATEHDADLSYLQGEMVYVSTAVYLSLIGSNEDTPPTADWRLLTGATLSTVSIIYPINAGPNAQSTSRQVYMLPSGFMRIAPQNPKAGQALYLGAPDGQFLDDWNFENNCFVSNDPGPLIVRFAADVADSTQFDPLFVEGLGCRIGIELAEILTQSSTKVNQVQQQYSVFMKDARAVNAIETGPVYPPEDAYIQCRL